MQLPLENHERIIRPELLGNQFLGGFAANLVQFLGNFVGPFPVDALDQFSKKVSRLSFSLLRICPIAWRPTRPPQSEGPAMVSAHS